MVLPSWKEDRQDIWEMNDDLKETNRRSDNREVEGLFGDQSIPSGAYLVYK